MCVCVWLVYMLDEWVLAMCLWCVTPLNKGSLLQQAIRGAVGYK